jgi:hypothetical protein
MDTSNATPVQRNQTGVELKQDARLAGARRCDLAELLPE